jgi:hypothetical protein
VRHLATLTSCRYCNARVYVAICSDGRWRLFGTETLPAAERGVWGWRRRQGMQEQEHVPGKGLHYCPQYRDRPGVPYELPRWLATEEPESIESMMDNSLLPVGVTPADVINQGGEGWTWVCASCLTVAIGEPTRRHGNKWYCNECA